MKASGSAEESLGESLRAFRTERGLSQADVARQLGCTQQSVARWEAGEEPGPRSRLVIEQFLQSDESEIIQFPGVEPGAGIPRLTPDQRRAVHALTARLDHGTPLGALDVAAMRALFRAVGLDWPEEDT